MAEQEAVGTRPEGTTSAGGEDDGAPLLVEEKDGCNSESQPTPTPAPITPPKTDVVKAATCAPAASNPPRNPGNGTRSVPLPSIEECLFGMPRDLDQTREKKGEKGEGDNEEEKALFFVPLNLLRRVSSQGIDDDDENAGSHRGLTWRLLLGFLPPDRREWDNVANKQRQSYHSFVQELFCLEDRDVDGSELRGHHSKRHSDKTMTKAEKRERRKRRSQQKKKEEEEHQDGQPRSPIKFVDAPRSSLSSVASASEDEDDSDAVDDENADAETDDSKMDASISQLLQDDPAQWNMSVREQKILERLTNHDAVNQLLVKRDCKEWNNFLENATLLDEIRKDVNRTHPHLYFYLEPNDRLGSRRYAALERILFVWAKLNKGVSLTVVLSWTNGSSAWCDLGLIHCPWILVGPIRPRHERNCRDTVLRTR